MDVIIRVPYHETEPIMVQEDWLGLSRDGLEEIYCLECTIVLLLFSMKFM